MTNQAAQATNGGHVIERSGDPRPAYLSEKIGRDFGAPYGGWTNDIEQASVYPSADAATRLLDGPLAHVAPFCKVVAK